LTILWFETHVNSSIQLGLLLWSHSCVLSLIPEEKKSKRLILDLNEYMGSYFK
jgi:hypothetical protein